MRGSNARQVLVEVEGLRLSAPFGPGFDLGGSALGFDSVSLWRGAAATYRGSGALAGALEFRTHHLRRPGTRLEGSVLRGSHDTLAGSASAMVATRDVSTRVGLGGRFSEGDFTFTDGQGVRAERVNNDHTRGRAFGATELRAGNTSLRAIVFHDQGERGTPGLSEFQERFDRARLDDQPTAAIVALQSGDMARLGAWSLDGSVRGGVQHRQAEYDNPTPFLDGAPIHETTRSTTASAGADAAAWGPTSVARIATDVRYEDWRAVVDAARTSAGIGASWEQQLDARWLAVAALRGDADSEGRAAVLPAIGGRWRDDAWSAQANVGRTFRSPNLDELYLDLESIRGNPQLVSERAWVADLGARWRGEQFGAAVTTFGRVVEDEIMFLPVTAYLVEAQNVDGTYAAGAEAEATLDRRPFRGRLAYTYTRARLRETDVRVPLQPEHAVDARVEVEPLRAIRVWTGARVRGPITLDVFGNTRDEAHAFWDAGLSIGEGPARFSLFARNLLDDDGAVDALQQPMPGRTLWASVRVVWGDHEEAR